jgi:hypothetical protein
MDLGTRYRWPLMALAMLALAAGLDAGLNRIGWLIPMPQPALAGAHGPLMIAGALGTIISIERAVALRRRWPYAAPLLNGLGSVVLMSGVPGRLGPLLFVLGSLVLTLVVVAVLRIHVGKHSVCMAVGALALLVGNLLWLIGQPFYIVVFWWLLFLILTISGERLELGRLRQLPAGVEYRFMALAALLLVGTATTLAAPDLGTRIAGAGALGLAGWLLQYDIARRTIRKGGLTRYIAVCLLSGYAWLGLSGLTAITYGFTPAGPIYDAMLHMAFVGFTFAMIFGHAPIIIPAVLGIALRFSRAFYMHLALLHLSLALRVAGDLAGVGALRRWGGLLNAITLLVFLVITTWAAVAARAGRDSRECSPSVAH